MSEIDTSEICGSRSIRRTKAQIQVIKNAIYTTLEAQNPATIRGLFYSLVSQGAIEKTEVEYKSTVVRLAGEMRREGTLPYSWIADNTRWMRRPTTWNSMDEALRETARTYRRSLWHDNDVYVEVWLEKEALAGLLVEETDEWDVPLLVSRGYASLTYLYEAAETIKAKNKPAHIYYLGDYDPSGVHIPIKIESELRNHAPDVEISFTRLAVNLDQIGALNLPTRPTKKTDSRSKTFGDVSVEVDAIPAPILRTMVRKAIVQHLDPYQVHLLEVAEQEERATLTRLLEVVSHA